MKKQSNFSELMRYAGGHKALMYLSLALSVISSALTLMPFVFIYLIIKEVIAVAPNFSEAADLARNGWLAVMFALVAIVVYFGALMCSHFSAFRIAGNMRKTLLSHIAKLPLGFIGETGSGKIRRIVNDSSAATETYLAHQLPDMAGAIAAPLGMAVMLFVFDWRFGLICLVPVVLGFAAMFKMAGPKMAEDMKKYQDALSEMNNQAVEYVRGIPVVKTFGQTVHTFARFKGSIDSYYKFCIRYCKQCRAPMLLYTVFINSAFAFLITLALILAGGEAVPQSILLSFIFYVIFTPAISTAMTKVMYISENGMIVSDALARVHSILDRKPLPDATKPETPKDHSVEFENVSFRYDNAEGDALSGVSFRADSGETVALVGPSGGGKTTAAGLVSRLWDATSGEVRIGGVNVKNIEKSKLNDAVSYVFQDSKLLKTSILENVRLARPDASREEVETALHKAQCDDIIAKLSNGIDTVIGTKGVYLSGGEQQRVAIARVMLKNSPIIILDEATAFADPENEALVQKAFEELSQNKTVIMIAHRLTTVKNADKILVIEDGKIEESGTHQQLAEGGGLYAKMWADYQVSADRKVGIV
ncbi:MAG: ABC transporter ATP-binding protein/permease [Bacteroides sp.]|nr:ABC transporter ATP-binding protein/permease [Eubacterium sp.]MCM1419228.1 ABC transporter ATP-binding protein/permease [Roseburia sp.]MCM1463466.1 ABC transporter ATP-binding protein/permease [Bacteroides sp.]